jgi:hypothetical protein
VSFTPEAAKLYSRLERGEYSQPLQADSDWVAHPMSLRRQVYKRWELTSLRRQRSLTAGELISGLQADAFYSDLPADPLWNSNPTEQRRLAFDQWEALLALQKAVSAIIGTGEPSCDTGSCPKCTVHTLAKPFLIAVAKDPLIVRKVDYATKDGSGRSLALGQDAEHAWGRIAPQKHSVGDVESDLKDWMSTLPNIFALNDKAGMARRLFDRFLEKQSALVEFEEDALNKAIEANANFLAFSDLALGAPGTVGADPVNRPRIHQHLAKAGWDINKVSLIEGLGTPAFNLGTDYLLSEDYSNGLKIMINAVQYVHIFVEGYSYNSCHGSYHITLKFVVYDVFGLDDDDLSEFGASSAWSPNFGGAKGFTAWWQLQHQFNYFPVITKGVVSRTFRVPAS